MKKVIDGKIYNTETAEKIAYWDNGLSNRDFGVCEETLYVTKKGTYFIHGEGGPLSRWSQAEGSNGRRGGEGVEVLSKPEALEWCEQHGVSVETISQYFEVVEG